MAPLEAVTERLNNQITVIELKRLLTELKEKKPSVGVRFRLMGELWSKSFMTIASITNRGVILKDEVSNTFAIISSLTETIQLEIDEPFQGYKPYNHYDIKPSPEF